MPLRSHLLHFNHFTASMLVWLATMFDFALFSSVPAVAQGYTYRCANGPGPGEWQVGNEDGGNGSQAFLFAFEMSPSAVC